MDFDGNLQRICLSIEKARLQKARYRIGPELETSGYGCEDHFLELDTFTHSWECIAHLIHQGYSDNIFLDIGAPVMHRSVAYNCRVLILNREILLIRPKIYLADDGNYRESRWFRPWNRTRPLEQFCLPHDVRNVCRNRPAHCPIGQGIIEFEDGITVACETCEELWTPLSTHIELGLEGVDIIGNGSGSHHALRKLQARIDLLQSASRKVGGVYLYSNQIGCDGGRLYYDGSALICCNGSILAHGSQFTLSTEVEVITAKIDIDQVRNYRSGIASRGAQAADTHNRPEITRIRPPQFSLLSGYDANAHPTSALDGMPQVTPAEEIARGPACWLWDYLRRSGMNGFFLPLSGGADSASTAAIVGSMCQMIVAATNNPNCQERLLHDIRRVARAHEEYVPVDAKELAGRLLHTVYMGCEGVSSSETQHRAKSIAGDIGAWHVAVNVEAAVHAVVAVFQSVFTGQKVQFSALGGGRAEDLALQNVQARVRMVVGYLFAQLTLWGRGEKGALLVLGSANVDESLRGYLTKYDCSAADINPIGGICKADLKMFLQWAAQENGLGYTRLMKVVQAVPTAELVPLDGGQTDEEDMGMSYKELTWFGRLRKIGKCGPVGMFRRLRWTWSELGAEEVARKVKYFFRMYGLNRHKMTTLTPSYHAEDYSPEDNRFDLRQFLYRGAWVWQFRKIDEEVAIEREAS